MFFILFLLRVMQETQWRCCRHPFVHKELPATIHSLRRCDLRLVCASTSDGLIHRCTMERNQSTRNNWIRHLASQHRWTSGPCRHIYIYIYIQSPTKHKTCCDESATLMYLRRRLGKSQTAFHSFCGTLAPKLPIELPCLRLLTPPLANKTT